MSYTAQVSTPIIDTVANLQAYTQDGLLPGFVATTTVPTVTYWQYANTVPTDGSYYVASTAPIGGYWVTMAINQMPTANQQSWVAKNLQSAAIIAALGLGAAGVITSNGTSLVASQTRPSNIPALTAQSDPGQVVIFQSQDTNDIYMAVPDSGIGVTCSDAGGRYVCADSGAGNYEIVRGIAADVNRHHACWYLDTVAGNDANACWNSGTPCKTLAAVAQHLGGAIIQPTYVLVQNGNLAATDPISILNERVEWDQTIAADTCLPSWYAGGNTPNLILAGTFTASRSSFFTGTGTGIVAASNLAPSATDSAIVWTADVTSGLFGKVTSGTALGESFVPLKDLGSGVSRQSVWLTATGGTSATFPVASDTYSMGSYTTVTGGSLPQLVGSQGSGANVILYNLEFASLLQIYGSAGMRYNFTLDKFDTTVNIQTQNVVFNGCYFISSWGPTTGNTGGQAVSCASKAGFGATTSTNFLLQDTIFQGAGITVQRGLASAQLTNDCIFDATTGVTVTQDSVAYLTTNLCGSGNTTGFDVERGSSVYVNNQPFLMGTAELKIDNNVGFVKPANAALPATCTPTTWDAGWRFSCGSEVFGQWGSKIIQ